jgi:ATP-dependent protease ClpP protease subunit
LKRNAAAAFPPWRIRVAVDIRILFSCCLLVLATHATAGPYEDGVAAYDQQQYATALKLWLPLAEQGNAAAQFNVAVLYEKGLGTASDVVEAARWYLKAAEQGDPDAQYSAGILYETGTGVTQNAEDARKWYASVLANPRAGAKSPIRLHAREHLAKLDGTSQEIIAYEGGRFVIVESDPHACVVAIQGLISHDASLKFDDVVARTSKLGCQSPWLLLESPGGELRDAIALGREIRFGKFRTVTRYECASACSLIFLAGADRELLGSRAKIGFHQAASGRSKDDRHCSTSFDSNGVREMRQYLNWVAAEKSDAIMHLIMQTSCDAIEWTSGQRAIDLGIATRLESEGVDVFGARPRPSR